MSEDQDKRTDEADVEDEDFEGHSFGGGSSEPTSGPSGIPGLPDVGGDAGGVIGGMLGN